jgi:hypothetical protein
VPESTHPVDRRLVRIGLSLAIVAASLSWSGLRPNLAHAVDTDPPDFFLAVEASPAAATDHLLIWLDELIDPTSIPDPSDFVVTVDGEQQQMTDVDLGYQGLVGSSVLEGFSTEGTAFLVIRWTAPPPPQASEPPPQASEPQTEPPPQFTEPPPEASQPQVTEPPQFTEPPAPSIQVSYSSGSHPLRDVAGNETPAFGPSDAFYFSDQVVQPFVDEGAGPDHLLLLVLGPIQPTLPAATDFSVQIGARGSFTATSLTRQHPDLGYAILDLVLPTSVLAGEDVFVTYTPSGTQLRFASGDPVELAGAEAFVSVAATPSRATPESDPPFTPVTVSPADSTTGASLVELTFANVTSAGTTTLQTSETTDGAAIPGAVALGDPPTYFDLSTTATFTGSVEVCISYGLIDFTDESSLRLIHEEAGVWVDVTTSVDQVNDEICGMVTSFSPFAVAQAVATFPFGGFSSPVNNPPTVNTANAGSAIPVRFSLGGDRGLEVFATGYPRAHLIDCQTGASLDAIEETASLGTDALTYNSATDTYTYVWKTQKAWAGRCRELVLVFDDTSRRIAKFLFH